MSAEPAAEEQPEAQDKTASQDHMQDASLQELLQQLTAMFKHSMAAGGELANLFKLELQLTLGDARRLLLVSIALLPVLLLSWVSLGVLAAWLVYDASASVTWGLVTFTLLQLLLAGALSFMATRYRRQLGFRRTQAHAKRLLQGVQGEPPTTD